MEESKPIRITHRVKTEVDGLGWIMLWLFCITLNTCGSDRLSQEINEKLDQILSHETAENIATTGEDDE